jgi:hypothetical protein
VKSAPRTAQREAVERPHRTGLWVIALFLASGAYAIYSDPGAREFGTFTLGVALGGGLPILAIALVPALIVWALVRFRREKIRLFLGAWTASLAVVVSLAELSREVIRKISTDIVTEQMHHDDPTAKALTDQERFDFIRLTSVGCIQSQESSVLNKILEITPDVSQVYCHCTTERLQISLQSTN